MTQNKLNSNNFSLLKPALFIVATPIGNLEDITMRAIKILQSVDCILCEDTRVTGKLLSFYDISTKLVQFDDYASQNQLNKCIEMLCNGKKLALVSDAGTPLISDPGYRLIAEAIKHNIAVESIPGACSVINALVLSGLKNNSFTFLGFLPHEVGMKEKLMLKYKSHDTTLIFFESPNRLLATLSIIDKHFNSAKICITREMTKRFEEVNRGKASDLIKQYQSKDKIKGEIVVLIENEYEIEYNEDKIKVIIKEMISIGKSSKDIVIEVCSTYGIAKKQAYDLVLALRRIE